MTASTFPVDEFVGEVFAGRFVVRALIGRGGMGAVFEALDRTTGQTVALKVVDPTWLSEPRVVARFQREIVALRAFRSAYTVPVIDSGTHEGVPFFAMERLRGESLAQRLERVGTLSVSETVSIARQVLLGLIDAHAAGIVHRDLKPDNVFLVTSTGKAPSIKLLDFGISKVRKTKTGTQLTPLTAHGIIVGTPLYLSPEQALARDDVDARADLWSLGAIVFECLTGRPPFVGSTEEQSVVAIATKDAPSLDTFASDAPVALSRWVDRALQRSRKNRFQTAREALVALDESSGSNAPRSLGPLFGTVALGILAGLILALSAIGLLHR